MKDLVNEVGDWVEDGYLDQGIWNRLRKYICAEALPDVDSPKGVKRKRPDEETQSKKEKQQEIYSNEGLLGNTMFYFREFFETKESLWLH